MELEFLYPNILKKNDLLIILQKLTNSDKVTEFSDSKIKNQFYWSVSWRKLSKETLQRDGECVVCKAQGKVTIDKLIVHHIYPIEYYPSERLNSMNVMTVCHACHNAIHYGNVVKRWDDEWW